MRLQEAFQMGSIHSRFRASSVRSQASHGFRRGEIGKEPHYSKNGLGARLQRDVIALAAHQKTLREREAAFSLLLSLARKQRYPTLARTLVRTVIFPEPRIKLHCRFPTRF